MTPFADSEKRVQAFETKCLRKLLRVSYLEHKTDIFGAEQDKLPYGSTGTSSHNCQETETCIVRVCDAPRHPLQNHPSGYLGGWATLWSAEKMLDGQHQKVDIPAVARTAHNGLLQERAEGDLC